MTRTCYMCGEELQPGKVYCSYDVFVGGIPTHIEICPECMFESMELMTEEEVEGNE